METIKHTSKTMLDLLHGHYILPSKPAPGYFVPEIQAPSGNRRADLIWLPLTHNTRGQIIGHEIKVNRADVINELADPTKADAWSRYCTKWWLVVSDPRLVDGLEIPDHWGVMSPPSGGRSKRLMTILKPAPELKPTMQTEALGTIMARMFYSGDDEQTRMKNMKGQLDYANAELDRLRNSNYELSEKVRMASRSGDLGDKIHEVLTMVNRSGSWNSPLKGAAGERYRYLTHRQLASEDIALSLLDIALLRQRGAMLNSRIVARIRDFQRALEPVDVSDIVEGLTAVQKRLTADLDIEPLPVSDEDATEILEGIVDGRPVQTLNESDTK